MQACPCRRLDDAPLSFAQCCEPILSGAALAPTAEALMRSRYSAFATEAIDYLRDSLAPASRGDFDREAIANWSRRSQWHGLEVIDLKDGGPSDAAGEVEFIAHFTVDGERRAHRERGGFVREDGRWFYRDEIRVKQVPVVKGAQPGRNDPCPCGSGKKYKKCHGA